VAARHTDDMSVQPRGQYGGHKDAIGALCQKMVGMVKRHEAFRMFRGAEYLCGIGDIDGHVDRTVEYQQCLSQFGNRLAGVILREVLEKLPFDPEFPPGQYNLSFTTGIYFGASSRRT
jgi:hypothetical protein